MISGHNGTSVKVAKYADTSKVNLIENNEYGFCSLLKATKNVLNKIELENKTITKITSKEREEIRLWNPVALREAIINAFVHNDYTREVPPGFEIFSDRIEITSAGGLPEGLSRQEFFEGFSVPRNKELMRIYKDLGLVEQLGSGVPRILEHYGKDYFHFYENFLRMVFPSKEQVTPQVKKLLGVVSGEMSRQEIQDKLKLSDKKNFNDNYLKPSIDLKLIEMTIPDKPQSSSQKYKLTEHGKKEKNCKRNFW